VQLDGAPTLVPQGTASSNIDDATSRFHNAVPDLVSEEEFQRIYAGMHKVEARSTFLEAFHERAQETPQGTPAEAKANDNTASRGPATDPRFAFEKTSEKTSEKTFEKTFEKTLPKEVSADASPAPLITTEGQATFEPTVPGRPLALLAIRDPAGAEGLLAPPRSDAGAEDWRDAIENTQPLIARPRPVTIAAIEVVGEKTGTVDIGAAMTGGIETLLPVLDLVEVTHDDMQRPRSSQKTDSSLLDFEVEVQDAVDESPLSFADATRKLGTAKDRDSIATLVLRAARTKFARACLLTVFPDRIVGWMGIGDGMDGDVLKRIVLDGALPSVFRLVAESRSHYLGPLARWQAHGAWVKGTGRKIPRSVAVFPILVKGRPVSLIYVDNGHDKHVSSDVGEILILAQQIAKAWETLLVEG